MIRTTVFHFSLIINDYFFDLKRLNLNPVRFFVPGLNSISEHFFKAFYIYSLIPYLILFAKKQMACKPHSFVSRYKFLKNLIRFTINPFY